MITKKDVKHIAALARIELTAAEEKRFEKELSAILGFVEKLNEVNTTNVAPMTGGTDLENIVRKDEQINKSLEEKTSALVSAAPEKKGGWIKVLPVRNFK